MLYQVFDGNTLIYQGHSARLAWAKCKFPNAKITVKKAIFRTIEGGIVWDLIGNFDYAAFKEYLFDRGILVQS